MKIEGLIKIPGYKYEYHWTDDYRYGILMENFGNGVVEISDTKILELARKLFPEKVKD